MTLVPRSLFGRLALLLVAVVAIATASMIVLFRQDRAALVARQLSDTKIAELKALRAALEGAEGPERRETLQRLGREYGARIFPESERPMLALGGPPHGPFVAEIERRLRAELGPGTEVRAQPGRQQFLVRLEAGGKGYWAALPMPAAREQDATPTRAVVWSLAIVALLTAAAYLFARYLARPLRELNAAVDELGRGGAPAPLPEGGPVEIAAMTYMHKQQARGEIVTGLLYVDPLATDLHTALNTSDNALNTLNAAQLCPGSKALEKINAALR